MKLDMKKIKYIQYLLYQIQMDSDTGMPTSKKFGYKEVGKLTDYRIFNIEHYGFYTTRIYLT